MNDIKNDIPQVLFQSNTKEDFGFEIVSLDKIAQKKDEFLHDPEKVHQLKFYNLIFFTEGTGRHFIDFKWYSVKKNSLVYISKEQVIAFDFSTDLNGYCLIFTEDYFIKSFSQLSKNTIFRLFTPQLFSPIAQIPDESEFHTYFNLLRKESKAESYNKIRIIQSLFTILLSKVEHLKQDQPFHVNSLSKIKLFQSFNNLLEVHFMETRNAAFYASRLAVTYKHLNAVCKELVNKTAKTIIDEFLILQVKRKLINSDVKSTELAYEMGFNDPTNFTKYFKKSTGLTPKTFKKSLFE